MRKTGIKEAVFAEFAAATPCMDNSIRQFARQLIEVEAAAVKSVALSLDEDFDRALKLIHDCKGAVLTTGVGKAGIIARKLAATFASTGTPSHFLHPGDALHGDVGSIRTGDGATISSITANSTLPCSTIVICS